MFSKLFAKKPRPGPVFAYARINARLQPRARGLFEDPLIEQLEKSKLGAVTGGGSALAETGEIQYCGIDIDMYDTEQAPAFICDVLNRRGAPKGSRLEYKVGDKQVVLPFGVSEGLAVYLNGTDLPAQTYETCDVNKVIDTLNSLVEPEAGGGGNVIETWHGPTETAIYMLGVSSGLMREAIAPFLAEYPLCQRARVMYTA